MSRRHSIGVALAIGAVVAATIHASPLAQAKPQSAPSHKSGPVANSEGGEGCDPNRTPDYYTDRFDGWVYPATNASNPPTITGATVDAETYSPYVSRDNNNDAVLGWSMLTDDVHTNVYAQAGYIEEPGNQAGGTERFLILLGSGPQSGYNQVGGALSHADWAAPLVGSLHTYDVFYNNTDGGLVPSDEFDFSVDSSTGQIFTVGGSPIAFNLGFTPKQVQILSEAHSNSDQSLGDVNNYERFTASGYYESGTWYTMPQSGAYVGYNNLVPMTEFGYVFPANTPGEIDIFDIACPQNTVSSGNTISNGQLFDGAATETTQMLSYGGPYYLESNASNGTFEVYEPNDPHDVNGCRCAKVLWLTAGWSSSDFMSMQTDGNLVVYAAQPLGAVWSTNTGGYGSGIYAQIGTDGNFVLYNKNNNDAAVWASGSNYAYDNSGLVYNDVLTNGNSLTSGNGHYGLVMQSDGNLVLYNLQTSPATWIWQSYTGGDGSNVHLCVQPDGNLVLYSSAGNTCSGTVAKNWGTQNSGSINHLIVTNNGYLQLLTGDDELIWQS